VARRAAREPLAYITGRREFWSLDFEVSPAVLIPRPETELLVEAACDQLRGRAQAVVADVCTGSGCVAVAVARECPDARVLAMDVSPAALEVAKKNAVRHSVADRVLILEADLLEGVAGHFDVIVANPPYVPDVDRSSLQPEVRNYEPALALFGGSDGLDIIRRLVQQSAARLKGSGMLIFEFGIGQAQAVSDLICNTPGLTLRELRSDLQGIPRTAIASRMS
jgi:release factor glutamine methyltransferase